MNAPVTRRALLGATATAVGVVALPRATSALMRPAPAIDADMALVDLAERLAGLVRRNEVLWARRSIIEDRIEACAGHVPPRPDVPSEARVVRETTATDAVLVMTTPHAARVRQEQALALWHATVEAHRDRQKSVGARLGLPRVSKLIHRSEVRMWRWTDRLADMRPQTLFGLGAKAAALAAIGDRYDGVLDEAEGRLGVAIARDAARLCGRDVA